MIFNTVGHTVNAIVEKVLYLDSGKDYDVFDENGNRLESHSEEAEDIVNMLPTEYSPNTLKSPLAEILSLFTVEKSSTGVLGIIRSKKPYVTTFKVSLPPLGYKILYVRESKKRYFEE